MAAARKPITQSQGEPASDQGRESNAASPAAASSLSMLAHEQFGEAFHGDVEETPPEPKPTVPAPPDLPEIPDEDLDEGQENVQVEGDDVVPGEPDAAKPAAEGDAEQPIATVRELVDYLEADPEWFNNLQVDVKVHDKASRVSLKDLTDSYEVRTAADERLEMLKARAAQAQQEIAERNAALDLEYNKAAQLVAANEQQLMSEAVSINWDQLKQEDPALWSAERVRIGERANQIQQMKQQTAVQYQQVTAQRQQEMSQQRAAVQAEQSQLLLQSMPKVSSDWADPQKVPEAKGRLATYLVGHGISQKEIEETLNANAFVIAEKARLWDESQGKLQVTKKRMRTVPKVMRPGAGREPSTVSLEKVRAAQQQLRKSGKVDDALTALKLLRQKRS